jgi:hypothetical protein
MPNTKMKCQTLKSHFNTKATTFTSVPPVVIEIPPALYHQQSKQQCHVVIRKEVQPTQGEQGLKLQQQLLQQQQLRVSTSIVPCKAKLTILLLRAYKHGKIKAAL